ncbi:MAG: glycoside hydrolase family 30 protein, partial [bacterium]
IDHVQPQNEVFANQLFPSCVWSAEDLSEFTEDYLIPRLDKDHPGVEVYYGTLNADSIEYVETLLENSPDIGGIGVQWAGLDMIDEMRERFPDMNIMQTESECNNGMNNWFTARHTYDLLHQSFTDGANSYMYWNMILNDLGLSTWMWRQNSMISIDRFTKEVVYNPEYYIMKHFSHFVKRGAVRIDVQNQNPDLKPVAFRNEDGQIILVLWNVSETRESIKVAISDYKSEIEVPANSISTVVIDI